MLWTILNLNSNKFSERIKSEEIIFTKRKKQKYTQNATINKNILDSYLLLMFTRWNLLVNMISCKELLSFEMFSEIISIFLKLNRTRLL